MYSDGELKVVEKENLFAFSDYSDELLALTAKKNKNAAAELITRYICSIEARARKYSPEMCEDLAQEGFIGLLRAVDTYDKSRDVKFSTYANVCIRNKMLSALNKRTTIVKGEGGEILEADIHDPSDTPENIVVERERLEEIYDKIISALSEQEWRVFQLFLTGLAYNQIALDLNVPLKTVDNAMQRVRRKLKSVLRSGRE